MMLWLAAATVHWRSRCGMIDYLRTCVEFYVASSVMFRAQDCYTILYHVMTDTVVVTSAVILGSIVLRILSRV